MDPRHFVREDGCAHPAAINAHTAFHFPAATTRASGMMKSRIVIVLFRTAVAEINYFMSAAAKPALDFFINGISW